jgi:hypothetical protein
MQSPSPALAPSMLALTNGDPYETAAMADEADLYGIDRLTEDEMPEEAYGMTLPGHPEQWSPWADIDQWEDYERFLSRWPTA